jgi:hypothetical protein
MEGIPRWITIKRIGDKPKLDPVNFVALLPLEEVEVVLGTTAGPAAASTTLQSWRESRQLCG